jgi:hypothetical protein
VARQVADAQAEIASWSREKREAAQLEGYMDPSLDDDALPASVAEVLEIGKARAALVERLRAINPGFDGCVTGHKMALKAADLLESQAARIAELEAALRDMVRFGDADAIADARRALASKEVDRG